jgi:transposase
LEQVKGRFTRLTHLWLDAGYNGEGKGKDWVQKTLGWTAQIVQHPPQIAPQEVMKVWAKELAEEGLTFDWQKLPPPKGFRVLPRRWVVERTISWICQNRRMSKDYERLSATGEAFSAARGGHSPLASRGKSSGRTTPTRRSCLP